MILMDGKVFSSEGRYVADIRANGIYDLAGKRLYHLRGQKIYKPISSTVNHPKGLSLLGIFGLVDGARQRTAQVDGGESGIRTHGTVSRTHAFQACALSHSAISPEALS